MKRISIKNKDGIETHWLEIEDETALIQEWIQSNAFGLPERPELNMDGNPTGVTLPADYSFDVTDISAEHALKECVAKRKVEYPSPEEFMNAYFDGGEAALAELQVKRLAVKAKYPKPQ
jgi:hypothetical protein